MRRMRKGGERVRVDVPFSIETENNSIDVIYRITGKTDIPEHNPPGCTPEEYDPGSGPEDIELQGIEIDHIEGAGLNTFQAKRIAAEEFERFPESLRVQCVEMMREAEDHGDD